MKTGLWAPEWNEELAFLDRLFNEPTEGEPETRSLRRSWAEKLQARGWAEQLFVAESRLSIPFHRGPFGLCVQTGNVCRLHSDFLKLQTLYLRGQVQAGIVAVPSDTWSKQLGSNHAGFSKAISDLYSLKELMTIPMQLIEIRAHL